MSARIVAVVAILFSASASAQDSPYGSSAYGGGWAPSLDTSLAIGRDVVMGELARSIVCDEGEAAEGSAAAVGGGSSPTSLFADALEPADQSAPSAAQTRFSRSEVLQRQSEAMILAAVKKRQPGAEAEYARVFRENDMAELFTQATAAYGLRNDDIADTLAAYWLVSWVVANDETDFSPAAALAVRDQVRGGIARTAVAGFSAERKHRLADEAIFNTLIATQTFEYAQSGEISKADYRRVADVTQKAFLGFGVDLRALRLTDRGFQK